MLFINVQVQQNRNRNRSEDDEAQADGQQPTQHNQTSAGMKVTWHALAASNQRNATRFRRVRR